jgi:alanyl-tRNA synthetase
MATHRLYYDDSYLQNFRARILACFPAEPVCFASGTLPAWEVLLDRTALYPTSGGQPNDLGRLGDAQILDVLDAGDDVAHIVDRELLLGDIDGCIDWPRRFDHMQQHTGQHLLSAMFHERFGLPTVSFHLGSDLCTIDLRGPEPSPDALRGAQRFANAIIFEDRPVTVRYGTAGQLAQQGVRKEVERDGILRAIEIESADLQPCGGTHVKSTGQIGLLLIRRCSKIRQDWRVEFVCGSRAERFATADYQLARSIADKLGCAPEEALAALDKSSTERDAHFKSLRTALQQLAESRAKLLVASAARASNGRRLIAQSLREENPELLLPLANEVVKNESTIALLIHEPTGNLVFAQSLTAASDAAGKDLPSILKHLLATFPGKGGGTPHFVRAKLTDPSHSAAALALAAKLIAS